MKRKALISPLVALCLLASQCILVPAANAAMVGTASEISQAQRSADRQTIMQALDRKEARKVLSDYGVSKHQISSRLDRLTDQQMAQLAHRANQLPAGQDALGVVLLIFLILILLDLLGVTNIFPAIHPANQ